MKRIDIHAHAVAFPELTPSHRYTGERFLSADELIAMYDRFGIDRGVLLPIVSPEAQCFLMTSEGACFLSRQYSDHFSWFCNIDPRQGNNDTTTDFAAMLAYYRSCGARGLGEVTANLPMDDPRVEALLAACQDAGMPVTIHIGDLGGDYGLVDSLGLPKLEELLRKFPKLILLGHSQKFWSEISGEVTEAIRGGAPKGPVAPGGRVPELLRRYPNLCGDLSAGSGCNAIMRDPDFGYAFLEEFQDRLFYGTDICSPLDIGHIRVKMGPFLDDGVASGKLSAQARDKICWGNALRLLEGRWEIEERNL